jgi:predicted AAA+ superfamily ATPase
MVNFNHMKWVERNGLEERIERGIRDYPVTLLLGPRQCGKTSLARRIDERRDGAYFDLEDPETPLQAQVARAVLKDLRGLVIIDEIQRQPSLFELLRVLADRPKKPARFLILGSASPVIVRSVSETLAGRVAYVDMGGFTLEETGANKWKQLWLRGGFPPSFLARDGERSYAWRINFIQSFLERDIPQLGIRVPAAALRRFWAMLAHLHGQVWNSADLARAMGVKEDTARHYLDILTGAFMIRQLPPWFENTGKRVVKAPKVYFRDTGLLHALLGMKSLEQLLAYPRFGFSWEGFAMEEVIQILQADRDSYFYKTHGGAELDLLVVRGGRRYGFEFKFEDRPRVIRSMHEVMRDLKLTQLWVIYSGDRAYSLGERLEALPLANCRKMLEGINR